RRESKAVAKGGPMDFEAARGHWAYQPIRRRELPAVRDQDWPATPIDRFILARLEAAGLTPSPPADRRTLIRRAAYDLTGLPPTPAEVEALATDHLDLGGERWRLAAMGFLTLGRLFDNNPHDVYDDQIDTVSRGLLGLTVACARCHDHKYDAVPTADYYSLYGVFAGSEPPTDLPLIDDPKQIPGAAEFEKQLAG